MGDDGLKLFVVVDHLELVVCHAEDEYFFLFTVFFAFRRVKERIFLAVDLDGPDPDLGS